MAETPPPISPTPTASQEDTGEELDQAATPAQTSAAPRREPPPAAAANGTDKAQDSPAVTSTSDAKQETGHVPPVSPPVRDGPARTLMTPSGIPLKRGPDGRLYNPAKGEPAPKSASAADLKPLPARTYSESGADDIAPKGGIEGLNAIPKSWGELPGSVSLSAAIEWVQQNRLYVVKETPGRGVKVDLSKAKTPAPSLTAISWLETSIRSYAKFIEVASKTATAGNDEAEFVRKERMRIGEIRALLGEMKDAGKE